MKNQIRHSFPAKRQLLLASVTALIGTALLAQAPDTTRRNNPQTNPATGGTYQTPTASPEIDATREINARTAATVADKLSWGDRRFLNKAADAGHTELQCAQLAAQRATNPEVRSFAQKLVDDHTKVNADLTTLAGQKAVKLDMDDDKDRTYKRLNKKSGLEFDREFVEHMVDEHEKAVKMFEKASTDSKDTEIRSFASKHVDSLRKHLQQAQGLQLTLMATTGRPDVSSGRSTPGGTTRPDLATPPTPSSSDPTLPKRN